MERIKRSNALSRIFMRYVLVMLGAFAVLVVGTFLGFYLLIHSGDIYPADFAEKGIYEAYDTILDADEVTEEIIPELCHYVLFSKEGKRMDGDLPEQYEQIAWNAVEQGGRSGKYYYTVISRQDEYVVLQYQLMPQYHSEFLREHLIGPQNVMSMLLVAEAIAIVVVPSVCFGKRIRKQMHPVLYAIGQIKNQNLEYESPYSGIKEFDDCLSAIDDMRDALKESLEQQWKTEQEKNRQMSALAHDIKTPLTIVRGNAELLLETELTKEQGNYVKDVQNSAAQIQNYLQKLIDMMKALDCNTDRYITITVRDFFADIKKQAAGLMKIGHLNMNWIEKEHGETAAVVYDPMFRAVMNVIQNAAEHAKESGTIRIQAGVQKKMMIFIVEDDGKGFTKEALLHGTEQFFMGDASRTGEVHYGIGLFMAKSVAEKYGGRILLANSENTGGAKVEICFPI